MSTIVPTPSRRRVCPFDTAAMPWLVEQGRREAIRHLPAIRAMLALGMGPSAVAA